MRVLNHDGYDDDVATAMNHPLTIKSDHQYNCQYQRHDVNYDDDDDDDCAMDYDDDDVCGDAEMTIIMDHHVVLNCCPYALMMTLNVVNVVNLINDAKTSLDHRAPDVHLPLNLPFDLD